MKCYHPIAAYQRSAGAPLFCSNPRVGDRRLEVGCGQCVGCRLQYAANWAVRCMHEAQLHEENCFATFTYAPAHLPSDLSLCHRHFQLFMKRFRKRTGKAVRFYMCGEYGGKYGRPHYHAVVFGFYPADAVFWKTSEAGFKVYSSKFLDSVWQKGSVQVGAVSYESCAYVARYMIDLEKGPEAGERREILDISTGETVYRAHEYSRCSLRPGIGANWFSRFATDVFPHDRVVVNGRKCPVPRYYDVLLQRFSPVYLSELKAKRVAKADESYARLEEQNWAERFGDLRRLSVHEAVKVASLGLLNRGV